MRYDDAARVRRSILGPIKPPPKRASRDFRDRAIPRQLFDTELAAEKWAEVHAEESCHFHQRWEVEAIGMMYAIGIYSSNSGTFSHWAE